MERNGTGEGAGVGVSAALERVKLALDRCRCVDCTGAQGTGAVATRRSDEAAVPAFRADVAGVQDHRLPPHNRAEGFAGRPDQREGYQRTAGSDAQQVEKAHALEGPGAHGRAFALATASLVRVSA